MSQFVLFYFIYLNLSSLHFCLISSIKFTLCKLVETREAHMSSFFTKPLQSNSRAVIKQTFVQRKVDDYSFSASRDKQPLFVIFGVTLKVLGDENSYKRFIQQPQDTRLEGLYNNPRISGWGFYTTTIEYQVERFIQQPQNIRLSQVELVYI